MMVSISLLRHSMSRSRKGAWIEIGDSGNMSKNRVVAPVRERGLKSHCTERLITNYFVAPVRERGLKFGRLEKTKDIRVAPVRERGLKWPGLQVQAVLSLVAPVRERGLKSLRFASKCLTVVSLP